MFRRQRKSLQWSWQMRGNLEICVEISVNQCQLISINATFHICGCGEIEFNWPLCRALPDIKGASSFKRWKSWSSLWSKSHWQNLSPAWALLLINLESWQGDIRVKGYISNYFGLKGLDEIFLYFLCGERVLNEDLTSQQNRTQGFKSLPVNHLVWRS